MQDVQRPNVTSVEVKKNSGTDLLQTIEAYMLEREIKLPKGTYNIGTEVIEVTFPSTGTPRGGTFKLSGHGQKTIIEASGPKVFDVLNTAWITVADYQAIMDISGLLIKHDCSNATDISLDLDYSHPWLRQIRVNNVNATRQGTGVKIGVSVAGGASSSGMQPTIQGVIASMYDTAWDLCLDHCSLINCEAYRPVTYGFFYRTGCAYLDAHGPMVVSTDADAATLFPWHFYNIGRGNTIHGFKGEMPTSMTNKVFSKTTQATIDIFGGDSYPLNELKDVADTGIHIHCNGATSKSWNRGSSAIVSGQTHVHVTHGLAGTPTMVRITPTAKSTADPTFYVWVDNIGATEFIVNCSVDPGVLTLPFLWEAEL